MISTVTLVFSTVLSTVALVAAVVALVIARRLTRYHTWPFDKITALEASSDEHDVALTQIHQRLRKVNARLAARDRRSRADPPGEDEPELPGGANTVSDPMARLPGEDDVSWKRRIRVLIAQGRVGHG